MKLLREMMGLVNKTREAQKGHAREGRGREMGIMRKVLSTHNIAVLKGQSYSDKKPGGRSFKIYLEKHPTSKQKTALTRDLQQYIPGAIVTFFDQSKKVYDTRPWIRVRVKGAQ